MTYLNRKSIALGLAGAVTTVLVGLFAVHAYNVIEDINASRTFVVPVERYEARENGRELRLYYYGGCQHFVEPEIEESERTVSVLLRVTDTSDACLEDRRLYFIDVHLKEPLGSRRVVDQAPPPAQSLAWPRAADDGDMTTST